MSKRREYRPPREGDPVGMINGWPDSRGLPTMRVVCEGRRDKGTGHKEYVVATFNAQPFDPSKGECGNWFWDSDAAVGGEARHDTTRLREQKAKRLVTEAEEARGWRPGLTEVEPKHHVGTTQSGGTLHLLCRRCGLDLRIKEAHLQEALDTVYLAGEGLPHDMAELAHLAGRKLPLPALIALRTRPRST